MKKIFCFVLSALSLFTLQTASAAREFQGGTSYVGSEWDKKKVLPYERCAILHSLEGSSYNKLSIYSPSYMEFKTPSVGFLWSWKDLEPIHANYYLVCWVDVNNYAFSIPIHVDKFKFRGLSLEFMGNALKFDFDIPDGKKVSELKGPYKGIVGGAGILAAGGKRASLKNAAGIELAVHGWYAGAAGVALGRGVLEFSLGQDVKLIDKTDISKGDEKDTTKVDPTDSGKVIADIKPAALLDYTFVKVPSVKTRDPVTAPAPVPAPLPAPPATAPVVPPATQ